jgi:hypothetical protein
MAILGFLPAGRVVLMCGALAGWLATPAPAHAADAVLPGAEPGVNARLIPCAGACAAMQWSRIEIAADGATFSVPTSMTRLDQVITNPAGRLIATGRLENGLSVIEVIDPARGTPLAEFWTNHFAISPDHRSVAFTYFVAAHGPLAAYDDSMVYVLDTTRIDLPADGYTTLPRTATPVFPPALVQAGRRAVLATRADGHYAVASVDFRWNGANSFAFMAGLPTLRRSVTEVTVSAPGGDWGAAAAQRGAARTCDPELVADQRFDSLLSGCK